MATLSNAAIRNTHLHERHFAAALLIATGIHLAILCIWMLAPSTPVVEIPVRMLNIKLGEQDEEVDIVSSVQQAPEAKNSRVLEKEVSRYFAQQPSPAPASPEALAKALSRNIKANKDLIKPAPAPQPQKQQIAQARTAAEQPHQYVRTRDYDYRPLGDAQPALAKNGGSGLGNSAASQAEIFQRYGQLISGWLKKFDHPPAVSTKQTVYVNIQVDRQGNVHSVEVDENAAAPGATPEELQATHAAARQMVHDANPLPPTPADYRPGEELLQFKIPFIFYPQ